MGVGQWMHVRPHMLAALEGWNAIWFACASATSRSRRRRKEKRKKGQGKMTRKGWKNDLRDCAARQRQRIKPRRFLKRGKHGLENRTSCSLSPFLPSLFLARVIFGPPDTICEGEKKSNKLHTRPFLMRSTTARRLFGRSAQATQLGRHTHTHTPKNNRGKKKKQKPAPTTRQTYPSCLVEIISKKKETEKCLVFFAGSEPKGRKSKRKSKNEGALY